MVGADEPLRGASSQSGVRPGSARSGASARTIPRPGPRPKPTAVVTAARPRTADSGAGARRTACRWDAARPSTVACEPRSTWRVPRRSSRSRARALPVRASRCPGCAAGAGRRTSPTCVNGLGPCRRSSAHGPLDTRCRAGDRCRRSSREHVRTRREVLATRRGRCRPAARHLPAPRTALRRRGHCGAPSNSPLGCIPAILRSNSAPDDSGGSHGSQHNHPTHRRPRWQ